jgi:hypothetical protein
MLQLSLNVCEHESVGFGKCSSWLHNNGECAKFLAVIV